jgi:hypothetical protein
VTRRPWWPFLVPLAVLMAGISLLSPAGRHQWALSLFRQPARYTVLFFDHPAALPATAEAGRPVRVSFTVGNREGRAVGYRYVMRVAGGSRSRIVGEASRTVAAGASWMVSTVVRPVCRTSPCRIQVSLPGHPETIDFLVAVQAAPAGIAPAGIGPAGIAPAGIAPAGIAPAGVVPAGVPAVKVRAVKVP